MTESQNSRPRIVHLTSVHARDDTRIFRKMCSSIASKNFEVYLVVADGLGNAELNGVKIHDVGKPKSRISRITTTVKAVAEKAKQLKPDICHLHDPELLLTLKKLKAIGTKVVFDSHEDTEKQILSKKYISPVVRILVSKMFGFFERRSLGDIDVVIGATPAITDKFSALGATAENVNNYPIEEELLQINVDWGKKDNCVCFVGNMSIIRGCLELAQAVSLDSYNFEVRLGGSAPEQLKQDMLATAPTGLNFLGSLSRTQVSDLFVASRAGIVTFLPEPNHIEAQPNKMFEYMSAGLPVIASDFPLWRDIILGNECGICVDPQNPSEIANAIQFLIDHQEEAKRMGNNGLQAVKSKYNWSSEVKHLFRIYETLLNKTS